MNERAPIPIPIPIPASPKQVGDKLPFGRVTTFDGKTVVLNNNGILAGEAPNPSAFVHLVIGRFRQAL